MKKAFLFLSSLLFSFSAARASVCASHLSSQKLLDRVESKAFARYFREEEVYLLAEEMAFLGVHSSEPLNLQLKGITFTFNKKMDGTTLVYTIPRVELLRDGRKLDVGQRPKGLSTGFARLAAVLFLTMEKDLRNAPEVTEVRITAGSVVNAGLISLFEKSGFRREPAPVPSSSHRPAYDMDFGPRLPFRIDPSLEFMSGMNPIFLNENRPRSWSVSFQVTSKGPPKSSGPW